MRLLISLLLCANFAISQKISTKQTDYYVSQVNGFLKTHSLVKKQADSLSLYGGTVTGFYLKNKLVLIKNYHGGEFGYVEYDYYINSDSLVFINEKKVSLKEPVTEKEYAEYERYIIFHTDKKGNIDYSQWPLGVDINNDYYFRNNSVTKFVLRNFGKPIKAGENEIEESGKTLISRYLQHLGELKGS